MSTDEYKENFDRYQAMNGDELFMAICSLAQKAKELEKMKDGTGKDYITELSEQNTWKKLEMCRRIMAQKLGD